MDRSPRSERGRGRERLECKVYVGDLARDATEKDLERAFNYYGPLKSVWVARNPPGFAFIEFEDTRDADDAVRGLDDTYDLCKHVGAMLDEVVRHYRDICGSRVRVEMSSGKVRAKPWESRSRGPPQRSRKQFDPSDRCYECGESGHYAYDCRNKGSGGGGRNRSRSRSRSRSRDRKRSYSRSRSHSRTRAVSSHSRRSSARD